MTIFLTNCSYQYGAMKRSVPGGYKKLAIPVFKNKSQEVGIEVAFTNSLLREFNRTKIAEVVPTSLAEVIIEGEIITLKSSAQGFQKASNTNNLPLDNVLATEYLVTLGCNVRVKRAFDGAILWQGTFNGERAYSAPQITTPGLNSANPLYNLSARRQSIDVMAQDLMAEAYSRITEEF